MPLQEYVTKFRAQNERYKNKIKYNQRDIIRFFFFKITIIYSRKGVWKIILKKRENKNKNKKLNTNKKIFSALVESKMEDNFELPNISGD